MPSAPGYKRRQPGRPGGSAPVVPGCAGRGVSPAAMLPLLIGEPPPAGIWTIKRPGLPPLAVAEPPDSEDTAPHLAMLTPARPDMGLWL